MYGILRILKYHFRILKSGPVTDGIAAAPAGGTSGSGREEPHARKVSVLRMRTFSPRSALAAQGRANRLEPRTSKHRAVAVAETAYGAFPSVRTSMLRSPERPPGGRTGCE